ncbi:DUF7948 domain-containing protein [Hymenobacter yonginensis]|uniref:Gliding motility-associated C-terminal domain-containing protein n=1 Tax=Hymenobacter yonginensis TaxID=748197 RepID=A0ABY7PLG6_9BACT|nr:gliding motility-associated C-terminal domain-containing protein [Hymenobacter yonginensis]WBO84036.1 gliding motility-associated C-terminal domain-containing protein [Hymenobacter yonginensis]
MSLLSRRVPQALALLATLAGPSAYAGSGLHFVENRKQWADPVKFRAEIPGGSVYLTCSGFVYDWHSAADLRRAHDALETTSRASKPAPAVPVRGHAVFVDFVDAAPTGAPVGREQEKTYHNYFFGNDPARWASNVALFGEVRYSGLYPGTDLRVYGTEPGGLKYDFEVQPGGHPEAIALRYRGTDGLQVQPDGTLLVHTSVTDVVEQRPYAYQLVQGQRRAVPCRYRLSGNLLHYEFPQGYDPATTLVIDPAVVACTYSGGAGETWGAASGYDAAGNIYSAGFAQTPGFPVTPGAYQNAYQGGTEVAISKFSPTGSQLLYATYLGGAGVDEVRALRTSATGDLYVLTQTSSSNFPVTAGCYDPSANGNVDLAITRFNATGTSLLGSTYLGGLYSDYGTELALTSTGVVVTGNTTSDNFPTTAGAYDRTLSGQDVLVASLSQSLTTLQWSTFLGGSVGNAETANSLQVETNGNILVAGATNAPDFPVTPGALRTTYAAPGDGFVARLQADGRALLASTFIGSLLGIDQVQKLGLDAEGNVVVCGTAGGVGVLEATPGALALAGNVFVAKLNKALTSQFFLAKPVNFSFSQPTALGVDACGNIHLAGFDGGGQPLLNPLPGTGTTGGVYLTTLSAAGNARLFGSYFGPSVQHAHGPAHRFDAQGKLYHSICTTSSFITTVSAYSPIRRSSGFDMLTFKIDQASSASTLVQATVAAVDSVCAPATVTFANTSTGSSSFLWNFADGTAPSTDKNPVHLFQNPGTYRVRLVALGTGTGCSRNDTTYVTVRVKSRPTVTLPRNQVLCPGGSLTLTAAASPGTTYRWNTGATTAGIRITQPGKYVVTVSNGSCTTRDSTVVLQPALARLPADTTGCVSGGVRLRAQAAPGSTYLWSTQATTPEIVATTSGRYTVRVTQGGCTEEKTVTVNLRRPILPPNVITPNGDGDNDFFKPDQDVLEPGTRLRLYNRWGRQVYATDNYRNDWNAAEQPAGVYYYTLENELFCTPASKGWVEVVK